MTDHEMAGPTDPFAVDKDLFDEVFAVLCGTSPTPRRNRQRTPY